MPPSFAPHSGQNSASDGVSCWHKGHCIPSPSSKLGRQTLEKCAKGSPCTAGGQERGVDSTCWLAQCVPLILHAKSCTSGPRGSAEALGSQCFRPHPDRAPFGCQHP